ncbi:MAG: hypothetical protein CVT96_06085 [Bacteroidetes bacterium HGW-Bacteroidetes-13]|nr:MAG: hypothetical protein CVT96_06085 [Bacteroidetes bacterium HGW-Bacteroidetes-13]
MKPAILIFTFSFFFLVISCKPKSEPVDYGSDSCHYCKMTIVSKQFASELVTQKGRVYKFDAIECMVHQLAEDAETPMGLYLIHDYLNGSDDFVDATKAYYLISEDIQSPMGAHLAGFKELHQAEQFKEKNGGEIFTWEELQAKIKH